MPSLQSPCLLQAMRTHPSHRLFSHHQHHHLRPSYHYYTTTTTTSLHRISLPPLRHHARRSFHWQSAITTAIEGSQSLMVSLHTTSNLPWFMVIPLVAVTVGAVFRLPFSLYSQRILQRRTEFSPLLQAWNARLQHHVQRDGIPYASQLSEVRNRQDKILKRIYAKLGLQQWKLWGGILSFPFWLVAIDGVRRLCGGPRGLIGSLITGSETPGESSSAVISKTDEVISAATSLPPVTDPAVLDSAALSSASSSAAVESAAATATTTAPLAVDPALGFEGCLWFTNLTASDPYHILPLALSATLVWNLLPRSTREFKDRLRVALGKRPESTRAQTLTGDEKVGLRERMTAIFHLSMIALASLVGPLTMDLPAALHLYWLASSLTNALFMKAIRYYMPIKQNLVKGCTNNEFLFIRPRRARKS